MNPASFPVLTPTAFDEPLTEDQKAKAKQEKSVHRFFNGLKNQIEDFQSSDDATNIPERIKTILDKMKADISQIVETPPQSILKRNFNSVVDDLNKSAQTFVAILKNLEPVKLNLKNHCAEALGDNVSSNKRSSHSSMCRARLFGGINLPKKPAEIEQDLHHLEDTFNTTGFTSVYNDAKNILENLRNKIRSNESQSPSAQYLTTLLKNTLNNKSVQNCIRDAKTINAERWDKFKTLRSALNVSKFKYFEAKHLIETLRQKLIYANYNAKNKQLDNLSLIVASITYSLSRYGYDVENYAADFNKTFVKPRDLECHKRNFNQLKTNLSRDLEYNKFLNELRNLFEFKSEFRLKTETACAKITSMINSLYPDKNDGETKDRFSLECYAEDALENSFLRLTEDNRKDLEVSRQFHAEREKTRLKLQKISGLLTNNYNQFCLNLYKIKCETLLFSELINIKLRLCEIYLEAEDIWQQLRVIRKTVADREEHLNAFNANKEKLELLRNLIHSYDIPEIFNTQYIQEIFPVQINVSVLTNLSNQIAHLENVCKNGLPSIDSQTLAKDIGLIWDEKDGAEKDAVISQLERLIALSQENRIPQIATIINSYNITKTRCEQATNELNRMGKVLNIESDYYDSNFPRAYFSESEKGQMLQVAALTLSNYFFTPITYAPYEDIKSPFEKLPDPILKED